VELRGAPGARLTGATGHRRAAGARLAAALLVGMAVGLLGPGLASAQELTRPADSAEAPEGFDLTPGEATRIADGTPQVRSERHAHPELDPTAYTSGTGRWQVSYTAGGDELVQVHLNDSSGRVVEAWTGPQVAWKMARGYDGAFGGALNAPYVWLPLCAVFLLPFVDFRRPLRILHLDLLVMLAFGVSHVFFNRAEIFWSVPLVYPVLAYLLGRLLWVGLRPRERRERLVPHLPRIALALGVLFLVGFRVALNVSESSVIDVGYAGVIGADRIVDGEGLYDGRFHDENEHGDTYGPVNYLAYVPFEQALSWSGEWDALPAAHAAAIAFDLLTILGLFLLGRRLRPAEEGRSLGVALAFAWASFPYTLFALQSNANDSLVAMLLVYALLAIASPAARGALIGLAAATKFAPLALVPLLGRGAGPPQPWRRRSRLTLAVAVAAGGVLVARVVLFLPDGGLWELYEIEAPRLRALRSSSSGGARLTAHSNGTSSCSIDVARPSSAASTSTALSQGSSSEVSNLTGIIVRNRSTACSRLTPMTPPRGPVMPTSLT
jgi:hypothetical protein